VGMYGVLDEQAATRLDYLSDLVTLVGVYRVCAEDRSMTDKESRLRELEEELKRRAGSHPMPLRKCPGCKQRKPMRWSVLYCTDCRTERAKEANRRAQRKRRQRETYQRREAAGLVKRSKSFYTLQATCAHCGQPFTPERSSARYCSARCRVAAHRAKKGA
jgi:hypothetical protein